MTLVESLARYLMWANTSVWEIVKTLSDVEFEQMPLDGAGSVRKRYVHLAEDIWEWFHDWHGEALQEPDFQNMSRDELYQFIEMYLGKWKRMIHDRTVDEFKDQRAGKTVLINFEEMFFHLVNHFTYHRGQIVMGLRMLGKEVPMTDYVPFRFSTA